MACVYSLFRSQIVFNTDDDHDDDDDDDDDDGDDNDDYDDYDDYDADTCSVKKPKCSNWSNKQHCQFRKTTIKQTINDTRGII